jgi:hypothetical protein
MGLFGGAAAAWPRTVRAAALPDAAAEGSVQKEEQDFPLVIASMPATERQRRTAVGVVILLIVAAAVIAPFASIQLARVDAFIPVLQTVLSVADLITAVLLFAQFSIQPQRALLALASGYISAARSRSCRRWLPGAYAPAGLIGDANSSAWCCALAHDVSAAILAMRSPKTRLESQLPGRSTKATIITTVSAYLR